MEIHENIYAVLPDKDPGDGMSFIIAKMNEAATEQAVVSQNGKKQKQKQKQNQQQQQELHADDFPSRPPPPRSSQREPQWKSVQKKPMHKSGYERGRYEENGYSGDRGRQDTTRNFDAAFEFPSLRSGAAAAAAAKAKKPVQQA
uniref:Uncharacterized protein n=1 Tax=Ananas comosus var. bracteatus TaxID=296719 RepID=A0A6V7NW31_ANACO|nr:unnamed protein product [Ananas comosus var. bracteatus]